MRSFAFGGAPAAAIALLLGVLWAPSAAAAPSAGTRVVSLDFGEHGPPLFAGRAIAYLGLDCRGGLGVVNVARRRERCLRKLPFRAEPNVADFAASGAGVAYALEFGVPVLSATSTVAYEVGSVTRAGSLAGLSSCSVRPGAPCLSRSGVDVSGNVVAFGGGQEDQDIEIRDLANPAAGRQRVVSGQSEFELAGDLIAYSQQDGLLTVYDWRADRVIYRLEGFGGKFDLQADGKLASVDTVRGVGWISPRDGSFRRLRAPSFLSPDQVFIKNDTIAMERKSSAANENGRDTVFDLIGLDGRTRRSVRPTRIRDTAMLLDYDGACLLWSQDREDRSGNLFDDIYVAAVGSRSSRVACPGTR